MPTISFASNALAILMGFAWLMVLAWVGSVAFTLGLYRQKHSSPVTDRPSLAKTF